MKCLANCTITSNERAHNSQYVKVKYVENLNKMKVFSNSSVLRLMAGSNWNVLFFTH